MKRNKLKGISFKLGIFDQKKYKGKILSFCYKKSQVLPKANLLFQKYKEIWLRVDYGGGHYNDGNYECLEDLQQALATFIEQSLIDNLQKDNL